MSKKPHHTRMQAMELVLALLHRGAARIERSQYADLTEFCVDGLRYEIGDADWLHLIDCIGWERAAKLAAKEGK